MIGQMGNKTKKCNLANESKAMVEADKKCKKAYGECRKWVMMMMILKANDDDDDDDADDDDDSEDDDDDDDDDNAGDDDDASSSSMAEVDEKCKQSICESWKLLIRDHEKWWLKI